mmetsp:Transcript_938/g.2642  ORF Transcript_938/g.2642 Transcript_938/m.2642 type:complete len:207 (+) Transcript_938:370-990(+)
MGKGADKRTGGQAARGTAVGLSCTCQVSAADQARRPGHERRYPEQRCSLSAPELRQSRPRVTHCGHGFGGIHCGTAGAGRSGEVENPGGLLNGDGVGAVLSLAPPAGPKDLIGGTAPVASPPPGTASITRVKGVGPGPVLPRAPVEPNPSTGIADPMSRLTPPVRATVGRVDVAAVGTKIVAALLLAWAARRSFILSSAPYALPLV